MKRIILSMGLAIIAMASPFFIQAADPQRIAVTHNTQAALAFDYPGLKFSTDELSMHLYKPFIKPYYLSRQAQAAGYKISAADSAYVRRINRWKSIKYKAELYDSALAQEITAAITDADIKNYYVGHAQDYKKYAVATFIQGALMPGHEADTAALKLQLRKLSQSVAAVTKTANDSWAINVEHDVTITPQMNVYPQLSHAHEGAVVCGKTGNSMACYAVLNYTPEVPTPMENIKNELRSAVKKEKIEQRYAIIAHLADSLIALRLDVDAIHSASGKNSTPTYGVIGADTIDKDFLAEVQMVNSRFHFAQQPDAFITLLRTYVSIPQMKARLLKKLPLQDSLILDKIFSMNYDSKLAEKYEKAEKEKLNQVPDAEIQAYYTSHQDLYMKYGQCAYLKAEVTDSSALGIALAQKAMLASDTKQMELKVKGNGKYVITNEGERSYDPSNAYYTIIRNTPVRAVSIPMRLHADGPLLLILPYRKDEPKLKPLDEVRDPIRRTIANEKLERYSEKLKADIFSKYTFVIE